MTYCCPELEKFMHPSETGLGLIRSTRAKRGTRFIIEFRRTGMSQSRRPPFK